ncbi:MAG: DNA recombination-dependent growth factor C [Myxococcota bacterium]|jgi:DNA recombination-dependent growth factor C
MGALSGTLSTTAFYVQGDLPEDFREAYIDSLKKLQFTEVNPSADQEESLGWVNIADPFDTDFDLNKVVWGSYVMATIRHDLIRLPAAAFKLMLQKRIREYMDDQSKESISKAERENLSDELERELKHRVLPAIRTYDVVWNMDRGVAWLFTTNKKVVELFVDLFEETFGLHAHERNPYSIVEQMGLDDAHMERVLEIEPAAMAARSK